MIVQVKNTESAINVSVAGRIDTGTSPQLQEELKDLDREKKLILDFADVEYISSAGLRVLLVLRKRYLNEKMAIINVSPEVNEIFQVTGFDSILPVELSRGDTASYLNLSLKDFLRKKVVGDARYPILAEGSESYSWRDLDRLSQIVAKDLAGQGVKKGSHVGIMGGNSANWVICFFAVQKLGAIAMLLNFNLTPAEVQSISGIGDITHLCYGEIPYVKSKEDEREFLKVVTDEGASRIRHTYSIAKYVDFRAREQEYSALEGLFLETVSADDPALVIFTSGSTGKPKAVLLSAYNILNSASLFAENYQISASDISCQVLPLFHIFGLVCAMFGNILKDAKMIIPENMRTKAILDSVNKYRCTQFYSVPTLLLAMAANKEFETGLVESVHCVLMGGAPVTAAQLAEVKKSFPNAFMAVGYGLSESCPVTLTAYNDSDEHVMETIGKPMKNVKVRIEDPVTKEELPQGGEGELLVMGFNTMVGYYHLPIEDQPIDEDGWLHTGDLARMDADGYIRLTGRIKDLIIRGGENIVPGEIEKVLTQFPNISDVKVMGIPDSFYGEVVGAAIVTKDGKDIDLKELKSFAAEKLANFKIPAYVFRYETFPMLSNGKIDAVNLKKDLIKKAGEADEGRCER